MTDRETGSTTGPVRVGLMDDYAVVLSGLHKMLAPFADRIRVVELDSLLPMESDVDVLLFDGFSRERITGPVERALRETQARFVLYTWHLVPEMVEEALAKGAAGCLSKALEASALVDAIERVAAGSVVISDDPGPDAPITPRAWPGRQHGLSARESEVLALIAQGLSNQEIADRAFLSINSVKTYIRLAYRKIGVERRTQAVVWATQHGFLPTAVRTIVDHGHDRPAGRRTPRGGT